VKKVINNTSTIIARLPYLKRGKDASAPLEPCRSLRASSIVLEYNCTSVFYSLLECTSPPKHLPRLMLHHKVS